MKLIELKVETTGARIDSFLAEADQTLSRSRVKKLINDGLVTANGKAVKPSHRVAAGEVVKVTVPDPVECGARPEEMPIELLYEDAWLAAVMKPAGLVVHPAPGHPSGTLVNALLHRIGDLSGVGGVLRPGIVHRLDKDTSGVLLVAKDDRTHRRMQELFRERGVKKTYLAVVVGKMKGEGVVDASIGRHPVHRKKMAAGIRSGRSARTLWKAVAELNGATLLEVSIETGRTHQIRVHLSSIGHPVAGDPVYGPRAGAKALQSAASSLPGQALHAWRIEFPHPQSGEAIRIEAPVPAGLSGLISSLGGGSWVDRNVPVPR